MRSITLIMFFVLIANPCAFSASGWENLDVVHGIIVEKWELGKWQVEDDWTQFEGYSRLQVRAEFPASIRGKIFTLYYNKWNVPRNFIPRRKGIRCGFAVPSGTLNGTILWPMIKRFWLFSNYAVVPPAGKPGDSN